MPQKKVLFITSTFPRSNDDVLANWIGKLAVEIKNKGIDIEIFAPSYKGQKQTEYFGIKVHRFRYAPSFLEFLTHDEGALFKLRKNVFMLPLVFSYVACGVFQVFILGLKKHYDFLHVHWPIPQAIFALVLKFIGRSEIILTFYGAEFALIRKVPLSNYFIKFAIASAYKVTAISSFTAQSVRGIRETNIKIIPFSTSISTKNKDFIEKKDNISEILFVGRLIERKGVKFLIDVMPGLLKNHKVHLNIIGQGPLYSSLLEQVIDLGLENVVSFEQGVDNRRLISFYQEADIFVLPSIIDKIGDTEGLGVVLLEAMSFKKPVIASNVGGIRDIVEDGKNGLLVPQKDKNALQQAIEKLIKDRKLAQTLGENGKKSVIDNFSWDKIVADTTDLYQY